MLYTVGEMAKLLGVAPSTLRYYDKEGLLPFVERSGGGMRMFKDSDYEWLKIIECLKKTGMSIKNIREYILMAMLGDETLEQRLEMIKKQKENITRQINELQEMSETLDYKLWYYETAVKAGTADIPRQMTDEEIPERFVNVRKKLKKSK